MIVYSPLVHHVEGEEVHFELPPPSILNLPTPRMQSVNNNNVNDYNLNQCILNQGTKRNISKKNSTQKEKIIKPRGPGIFIIYGHSPFQKYKRTGLYFKFMPSLRKTIFFFFFHGRFIKALPSPPLNFTPPIKKKHFYLAASLTWTLWEGCWAGGTWAPWSIRRTLHHSS